MKSYLALLLVLCAVLGGCNDASVAPNKQNPQQGHANLVGLTISSGTLSPSFDSAHLVYSITVNHETESLFLTPTFPIAPDLSVLINGKPAQSGVPTEAIGLSFSGTDITLVVISESDSNKVYTFHVHREIRPSMTESSIYRRIYINDQAVADSLPSDLIRTGLKFVLQPGKSYRLSLAAAKAGESLDMFYYGEGRNGLFRTVTAVNDSRGASYTLTSDLTTPEFFAVRLSDSVSQRLPGEVGRISLTSDSSQRLDTLKLRLLFIRKLTGLPDSLAKAIFTTKFYNSLAAIFSPAGITIEGSYEIVEPDFPRLIFPYNRPSFQLPGTRAPNCAHLYLVDSISSGTVSDAGLAGLILGFAPREAVDLDKNAESRVLLANPLAIGVPVSGLAVTAAHELGHLLGLRHTVSTQQDLIQDNDASNIEDGFTDTKYCTLNTILAKKGSRQSGFENHDGQFCLRTATDACNFLECDIRNLMYPYDCGTTVLSQWALSKQQTDFVKRNLANYRR